jgi:hypothetical protein
VLSVIAACIKDPTKFSSLSEEYEKPEKKILPSILYKSTEVDFSNV